MDREETHMHNNGMTGKGAEAKKTKAKETAANVTKELLIFTLPLILSGLFQQLFNWVDAFIVGNIEGELALAGIGATAALYNLFVTIITGFTSGLAVLAAQYYGRGEKKKITGVLASYSIMLGVLFAVIALTGIIFSENILCLLDTPENIFASAEGYLRILLIGIPFLAVYNTYSAVLRGVGNSRAPFLAVLVSSAVNVVLDIFFVAVLGWGAPGAAAATALSQAAMTIFVIFYAVKNYPILRFRIFTGRPQENDRQERWNSGLVKQGAKFGFPPAIQSGVSSVGSVFLQHFMNGFGEQTVAAITTAYRVDTVIFLPIINLGSGIATIVAQNIGAGDKKRACRVFRAGAVIMTAVSLGLTAIVLVLGTHLIAMFGLTSESVVIGSRFFRSIASFYLIYGLSMAIRGYLEGTGDMVFSGVTGILALLVRIICSYALKLVFGNMVVAYAEAFSWMFLLAILLLRYLWKRKSDADVSVGE